MVDDDISSSIIYSPYSCFEIPTQDVLRALIPKSSAALSIVGSSHIITLVCMKWKEKKSSIDPYQRIMAMCSVYDILYSFFVWLMGTWMVPSETGWFGAAGNTATCTMQGLFNMPMLFGLALYQMMLSLQMMLMVTYKWTSTKFQRRLERKMHISIISVTFLIALVPLFFQGYNPSCGTCEVHPLPRWCGDWYFGDGETECLRGNEILSDIYVVILMLLVIAATLFCMGAMFQIYLSVYRQERRNMRYSFNSQSQENHAESKRIRKTMLLYLSSFCFCWLLPGTFWYLIPNSPPSLMILGDTLIPLMGFFNMLVFFLPKCVKYQEMHPGTGLAKCYLLIVFKFEIRLASNLKRKFKRKFKQNSDVEGQNDAADVNNANNGIDVNIGIGMRSCNDDCCSEVAADVELPRDIEVVSNGHDAAAAPADEPSGDSRRRGSFVARVRRTSITGLLEFDPIDIDDGIGFQRYNQHRRSFQDRDTFSLDAMDHEARDEPERRQSFVARLRRNSLTAMLIVDNDDSVSSQVTDEHGSPRDGDAGAARDAPGRAWPRQSLVTRLRALFDPTDLDWSISSGATNEDGSSLNVDLVCLEAKDDIPPKMSDVDHSDEAGPGDEPGREEERKDASPGNDVSPGPAVIDESIRSRVINEARSSLNADPVSSEAKDDIPPKVSDNDRLDEAGPGDEPRRDEERKDALPGNDVSPGPAAIDELIRSRVINEDRSSLNADPVSSKAKDDIAPKTSDNDRPDEAGPGDKPHREEERKDDLPGNDASP